ncbi:MAG: hypothetical protein ACI8R4_003863 [Paracoccaceae bacterium]|jgi:hypothetical protein
MKRYLIALPIVLAAASAPAEVSKSKSGIGFSSYGTYEYVNVGPAQAAPKKASRKGATGKSDVPVYSAKSPKMGRVKHKDAAVYAMHVDGANGAALRGVAIFAGDVTAKLRIVSYDKHVFGVVDGFREPMNGSQLSGQDLGQSFAGQVARRTGCSVAGYPLMQFKPGHLDKLSVPLAC